MTVVLIAVDRTDAQRWIADQPSAPARVVIVTPRSRHAARGHTAAAVLVTADATRQLQPRVLELLIADALPCVFTVGGGRRG